MKSFKLVAPAMCCKHFLFVYLLFMPYECAFAEPVDAEDAPFNGHITYDQRQTGKYNIHVSIKDVAIIEMDQNEIDDVSSYGDEDYYYDEEDLTVKPIKFTTLKPSTPLINPSITNVIKPTINNGTTTSSTASTTTQLEQEQQNTLTSHQPIPIPISHLTTSRYNFTYSPNLLADIEATYTSDSNDNDVTQTTLVEDVTTTVPPAISSPLTLSNLLSRKTTNVVILDATTEAGHSPTSTQRPTAAVAQSLIESMARTKDIPIIPRDGEEPLQYMALHKRTQQHHNLLRVPFSPQAHVKQPLATTADELLESSAELPQRHLSRLDDSKIYKFRANRRRKQTVNGGKFENYPMPAHIRRCRSNQYRDSSGNCRIKRSSSLLKRLFSMLVTLPFVNNERNNDDQ